MHDQAIRILAATVLAGVAQCARAQQATRGPQYPSLPALMQTILGIEDRPEGYLKELAAVFVVPGNDLEARDKAIDNLVEALVRGGPPAEFHRMWNSKSSLQDANGFERAPDWPYGTTSDRLNLANLMIDRGLVMKGSPSAPRYVKAGLLLLANAPFLFGENGLAARRENVDEIASVAGLDRAAADRLRQLLDSLRNRPTAAGPLLMKIIYAEAAIIKSNDDAVSRDSLSTELDALKQLWEIALQGPTDASGLQVAAIADAWSVRNILMSRGDATSVKQIDDLLASWRAGPVSDPIRRRIDQAHVPGEALTSPRIFGPGAPK